MDQSLNKAASALVTLSEVKEDVTCTNQDLKDWKLKAREIAEKVIAMINNSPKNHEEITRLLIDVRTLKGRLDVIKLEGSSDDELREFCVKYCTALEDLFNLVVRKINDPLILAFDNFVRLPFPRGHDYHNEALDDWIFELPLLEGHVVGIVTNTSNNRHFLSKLRQQMKEKRDELASIKPLDAKTSKVKEVCSRYFANLECVVEELLKKTNE